MKRAAALPWALARGGAGRHRRPEGEGPALAAGLAAGGRPAGATGPFAIGDLFTPGQNAIKVRFRDRCAAGGSGSSDVYLTGG